MVRWCLYLFSMPSMIVLRTETARWRFLVKHYIPRRYDWQRWVSNLDGILPSVWSGPARIVFLRFMNDPQRLSEEVVLVDWRPKEAQLGLARFVYIETIGSDYPKLDFVGVLDTRCVSLGEKRLWIMGRTMRSDRIINSKNDILLLLKFGFQINFLLFAPLLQKSYYEFMLTKQPILAWILCHLLLPQTLTRLR